MILKGHLWKEGRYWTIEVPLLAITTQGTSRKDALEMIADAIDCLIHKKGLKITVKSTTKNEFGIRVSDIDALKSFILKRNRARYGLTLEDMRCRLGYKSRNSYAQYELNKTPSLDQMIRFLEAMDPNFQLELSAAA